MKSIIIKNQVIPAMIALTLVNVPTADAREVYINQEIAAQQGIVRSLALMTGGIILITVNENNRNRPKHP